MWKEAWLLLKEKRLQKDKNFRANILTYNLSDVVKAIVYIQVFGNEGSHAELEIAISDTIAQLHMICESNELNYKQLEDQGLERLLEKLKELK